MNDAVDDVQSMEDDRGLAIVRTSIVGIIANIALALFKALVGFTANSIAIMLDAVNNLSDAISSVITIVGTKLAARRPTSEHPYGFGRIEYLSTIVIASIVLGAGISSLIESANRIIAPESSHYDVRSFVVIGVAVLIKLVLGLYTRSRGRTLDSGALVASGTDALTDALLSLATLIAALVDVFLGVSIDAWLGVAIAAVIIHAGIGILRDAINRILGERLDATIAAKIHASIDSIAGVESSHDLILNDYGPSRLLGSVHIEVDDTMSAREIDSLAREITATVYRDTGAIVHTVGIYSSNTTDAFAKRMRDDITRIACSHEYVRQIHGFYLDEKNASISFDIVVSFDAPSRSAVYNEIVATVQRRYPEYSLNVALDSDMSD